MEWSGCGLLFTCDLLKEGEGGLVAPEEEERVHVWSGAAVVCCLLVIF